VQLVDAARDIGISPPLHALIEAYERWAASRLHSDFETLLSTLSAQWDGLALDAASDELRERFPKLADEDEFWCALDTLWAQDSETFESEPASLAKVHTGLKMASVLVVIIALLTYFVVPFGNPFGGSAFRGSRAAARSIPLAPKKSASPKLPV